MRKSQLLFAASLTACLLGTIHSSASARSLFSFAPGQPTGEADNVLTINIGNDFTVGASTMKVTAIGAFVGLPGVGTGPIDQADGLTTVTFEANLYSFNDTPISSTLIPIGTPVDAQGFAYVPYSINLLSGNSYVLTDVATDPTGATALLTPFADNSSGGSAGTFDDASFNFNIFGINPVPPNAPPGSTNPSVQEFLGGNLQFTTPEPSSIVALVGLSGMGLFIFIRRRKA